MAVNDEGSLNVPSPEVVQEAEPADPEIVPASATVLPTQIVWAAPASTTAAASMSMTTLSLAGRHGPAGSLVVKVSVAVPLVISVGPGVYTAFEAVLSLKVPSPEVDHVALVAAMPKVPERVAVPLEQIV